MNYERTKDRSATWLQRAGRLGIAVVAVLALPLAAPLLEAPLAETDAGDAIATLGGLNAEAQWGMGRRAGRRSARRTVRRRTYAYGGIPAAAAPVVVSGTHYYQAEGVYYQPVMVQGQVTYQVTPPPS